MKYYLIAGERSGDLHGSNLIKALKSMDSNAVFRGFGGDAMEKEGAELTLHYRELAFMGIGEVITNLLKISGLFKLVKKDILQFAPDVLILIDFGGFNMRMAKFARGKNLRVFYYISPKIWAWNQSRALKIKRSVDKMFVILPFEKDFYSQFDYEVDYVGNPLVDAVREHVVNCDFMLNNALPKHKKLIALLPGSRRQELLKIIPVMKELALRRPEFHFAVAAINTLNVELYSPLQKLPNVSLVFEQTYDMLNHAYAAIVASGTATLETALFHVPQVVVYKTSPFNYMIGKYLVSVQFISLVNLIAGKEVVKELLQGEMNLENTLMEFDKISGETDFRINQLAEYGKIREQIGTESPSLKTADLMIKYLNS